LPMISQDWRSEIDPLENIPETQSRQNYPDIHFIYSCKLSLACLCHFYDFRYLPLGIPFAILSGVGAVSARTNMQ
jgi:multidrug transporter EmrE-like cation transporter